MNKYILSIVLFLAVLSPMCAQQDAAYSMYMFNGLYINPAYAGSSNVLSMMAIYRHQWVGVVGAPRTFNVSASSPLKKDMYALGITISDDNLGLTNAFSVTPAFAFRPQVKKSRISIGVQGSFTYYTKMNSNAVLSTGPQQDDVYMNNTHLFVPNFGVGIYVNDLENKRYFIGASVPHLLPYSLKSENVENPKYSNVSRMYNYYLLTAGYVIGKKVGIVKVMPSFLMKWQQGLPKNIPDFDINAMLILYDRVKVGASYRTGGDRRLFGESVVGMLEVLATPQFKIGYAYDANISHFSSYNKGTHEIMLGYDFSYDKKRFVTPRYGRYF